MTDAGLPAEVTPKPKRKPKEPPPPTRVLNAMGDHAFSRVGMGYQLAFPSIDTTLNVDHIKRSSEGLSADLVVRSRFPGARTYNDDILHASRINLAAGGTRFSTGKLIANRVEGGKESLLDWGGFVDELATLVMFAERDGEPVQRTNGATVPESSILLMKPFLPTGMPTVFFADGMSSKSTLAVAFGISVVTGHSVIPGIVPRTTGQVLYLDWETDFAMIDVRQKQISAGAGLPPSTFLYRRCRRPLTEIVEDIARMVASEDVKLLVVDSMTLAMGSGRDNADPADTAIRFYGALAAIGGTALCIDHIPKSGDGSKPYGSVYRSNFARATWAIKRIGEEEGGRIVHLEMTHEKHNTTRKFAPVGLAIEWDEDEDSDVARAVTIRQEAIGYLPAVAGSSQTDRIEAYLRSVGHPLEAPEIAKANGWNQVQIRARLNEGAHQGRFKKVPGGWWIV